MAFVRGKYSDSFVLLCDAKKLYEECGSSRTQQVCLQLRLMSMLLPSVELTLASIDAFPTHQHALVEDIVQCFLEDNVVRLRSELAVAETTLGRFAAVELCGALVRNRMYVGFFRQTYYSANKPLSRRQVLSNFATPKCDLLMHFGSCTYRFPFRSPYRFSRHVIRHDRGVKTRPHCVPY